MDASSCLGTSDVSMVFLFTGSYNSCLKKSQKVYAKLLGAQTPAEASMNLDLTKN